MVTTRSAVVVGGTGLVGQQVLRILGDDPLYHSVTSLVRRDVPAPPGIDVRRVDFDRLGDVTLPPVDDAFCCLGTTRRDAGSAAAFRRVDLDYLAAFATLARRAGATRFMLVSSVGASAQSPLLYSRTKGEGEAAVAAAGFSTVVIVRPSFLAGNRANPRPVERMALRVTEWMRPLMVGPLRRYAPVNAAVVAGTLVAAAANAPGGVTMIESERIR